MTISTHDMVLVHRAFRREFALLPEMIVAVSAGDTGQVRTVQRHALEMIAILHHHHGSEDDLLWPRLFERAPLEANLLRHMEDQHVELSAALDAAERTLAAWAHQPMTQTTGELAALLRDISVKLNVHLDEEEVDLLPVAARYLSQAEWAELGKRGMASMPKSRSLVFLGHILEDASPAEERAFLGHLPAPVRLLFRLSGKPRYQREVAQQRKDLELTKSRGLR